jgi:hypothetical protein
VQVGDVVVDHMRALLGHGGQLGSGGGVEVFADRGVVQAEFAADR